MDYETKVARPHLEDESASGVRSVNVHGNSLQLTVQCTNWNNEGPYSVVASSAEYEKASESNTI